MAQAHTFEAATESVESVFFSFFTDEEVRKYSVVKITNPISHDDLSRPLPAGLYDPLLGTMYDGQLCKSCGQNSMQCVGHCGHIDLVLPVYNPLLFKVLHTLLRKTCFFCYHFRVKREKVEDYASRLELIIKGDTVRAANLESSDEQEGVIDYSDHAADESSCKSTWSSLQYRQAKAVLNDFMGEQSKGCHNCGAKNPKITSPTFGWFHMGGVLVSDAKANVIKGINVDERFNDAGYTMKEDMGVFKDSMSREKSFELPDTESSGALADGTLAASKEHERKNLPTKFFKQRKQLLGPLLPSEVKHMLKRLWENEARLFSLIFDIQGQSLFMAGKNSTASMFFIEALLVPPSKFRPSSIRNGQESPHPQSVLLRRVLEANISLGDAHMNNSERHDAVTRWMNLQQNINILFDSRKAIALKDKKTSGICQLLEKKEGIFRQKMMGKRVNFACRSVISPDPYLAVNEIGIPPYFALKLTYPERVTPWNVNKLRHAIVNGPEIHPGATHFQDKSSTVRLPPSRDARISVSRKLPSSRGALAHYGKGLDSELEVKVVYRHLQDGDIVLVNRQPTLHKPSIMAHVVRVLKGEKTLRMHYTNCSTYNADFDGDEMNVHLPQDEISRAEAINIVNANNQYVVPTSGAPIRGLIQDHIVASVLLTKKDTFLTRDEYQYLLYASGLTSTSTGSILGRSRRKVSILNSDDEIHPLPPAIWKPNPLWTGKQVITTILYHITRGHPPFNVRKETKVDDARISDGVIKKEVKAGWIKCSWLKCRSGKIKKSKLIICKNELVHGVIDKNQFAQYGMVHVVQELYGSNTAGMLLSVLSRLFTVFLQMHGFTCGVDDLLVVQKSDFVRKEILEKHENDGEDIHKNFLSIEEVADPIKLQKEIERAIRNHGESAVTSLDRMMSNGLGIVTSEVNSKIIPSGLLKPFPKNSLSLMTTTGAKGSLVNFTQISSLLGQQELEGKRVPRMVSGKTLPCFPPWDCTSRAGGFISDRFLTGLRPQEYYFHCMAGREGLVDTAIKTSRSGYLQRCLIKNLECLRVNYDHTVRDVDGSIVQFCYGEDGVDVHKTSCIEAFKLLAKNQRIILEKHEGQHADISNGYIEELPETLKKKAKAFVDGLTKKKQDSLQLRKRRKFMNLVKLKYLSSLAQPGEAVGVIAAQSVGEPSTQMTLNTFHHAGRGEMNVTLGIPRLQEILQRASEKIKTPVMTCPLRVGTTREEAERLAAKFRKVTVADVIESMEVCVVPFYMQDKKVSTVYKLKVQLFPSELYPPYSDINLEDCEETLEGRFIRELEDTIQNHMVMLSKIRGIKSVRNSKDENSTKEMDEETSVADSHLAGGEDDDEEGGGDDDHTADDLGVDGQKRKRQAKDEMDYDDGMETEVPIIEDENNERELAAGFGSEIDQVEEDGDYSLGGQNEMGEIVGHIYDGEDEALESTSKLDAISEPNSSKNQRDGKRQKDRIVLSRKKSDRRISTAMNGLVFEVLFDFSDEPHVLLAQIAEKAAKKVYVKRSENIDRCSVIYKKDNDGLEVPESLQTAGVNFSVFWNLEDHLDVKNIVSNDVFAMLHTYGVEAARATIEGEVKRVFKAYGIGVDVRHLSLIADFMTAAGGYRPMNRFGMADNNTSPFAKISYETATKFMVEAALHGEVEMLESPSARVSLGLPVKLGTGCFDIMHKLPI